MPQAAWSAKRERQYKHIKSGLERGGDSEAEAEEDRGEDGEQGTGSQRGSQAPEFDFHSGPLVRSRGGLRSHRGAGGRTRDQLYEEARRKGIEGRSKMNKAQLAHAVGR